MERVLDLLRGRPRCAVTAHVRPDGDAVGALLATARLLEHLGAPPPTLHLPEPVPERLRFLPGSGRITCAPPAASDAEVLLALDTATPERTGFDVLGGGRLPLVVVIDHHASNRGWGDVNWVEPTAPATSLMLYRLCGAVGLRPDQELATLLFTGLMTDTGYFRHSCTSPEAFACAAELMRCGAPPADLYRRIFEERPVADLRLMGALLADLRTSCGDRIAWIEVSAALKERTGLRSPDLSAVFGNLCSIPGLDVGLCLDEQPDGGTTAELRSTGRVNVGKVAEGFGGGGHQFAAGCSLRCPPGEARALLLDALEVAVRGAGGPARG